MTVEPVWWASLRSLEILMAAHAYLTLQWKEESWRFVFLPVGCVFLGESRCGTVQSVEFVTSCRREEEDRYVAHLLRELPRLLDPPIGWGIYKYRGIARLLSPPHSVLLSSLLSCIPLPS